ncbi:putative 2-hydroxyacid dehydrogenase [Variibacter gotjawalensis]|uniref:Putative 2-hydroxyacid dehydrogenase n=1 Tax=Variibacter gotjawalensis TaxID=1333996 RepID=A0A0S3PVI9_9BRAD|nr:D-2-hydroxyacid dehydrogenase family protein [Variibacter gotjawalensis]NIK50135.1 D-3-phosphoglycerate dehydrogenase [Variibacter gotjawalensis]RZS46132.1 D-3-phosphoglycerate dehydrogenase [Variibacter gotjawalensis]BAT59808.1 putative 2-hydroxyacid dehydrogenase [Variibacter gotjawalensis]
MPIRCVVLDDYQNVALKLADWSSVTKDVEVHVINEPLADAAAAIAALKDAEIVCLMRERTPMPKAVIDALPKLKLIITTGAHNASVDLDAAAARGIVVSGTGGVGGPTAELAIGLIIDLARSITFEASRMRAGQPWQVTVGRDLAGSTLGVLGLGKLGGRVARIAQQFGMNVIAWSQNLTEERCREIGATRVSKEELFAQADFITIHLTLSDRTRGLITVDDFKRMKKTAYIVNTSRGPIIDEDALYDALKSKTIAGAALDVYNVEPLPTGDRFRKLDNVILTPHLGYVTEPNYRKFYEDTVEDIRAFLDGSPVRPVKNK